MSEQVNTKQVPTIRTNEPEPISTGAELGRKHNPPIPWSVYFAAYFIQGAIMPMLLLNVAIYLRQCLGLDWYALTASFIIMLVPVLLRPLFAFAVDKRPASLSPLLVVGELLVFVGSILAGLSVLEKNAGLLGFTTGFSAGIVGATILNVVTDSHIVRSIPLDKSARVNSSKKTFSFIGGALTQIAYVFLVGKNVVDSSGWAYYFSGPALIAVVLFIIITIQKKSLKVLPDVAGLPPLQAQWLSDTTPNSNTSQKKLLSIGLLVTILFLFFLPDGLVETTWENFVWDTYGADAWYDYSRFYLVFGIISIAGFMVARRSGKRAPEWDLLWYIPMVIGYYVMVFFTTPFQVVLLVTAGFQIIAGFIQIRILQSMQSHSYFKKAGFTFQIFMTVLQVGKFVGIGLSGMIMTVGGYAGIFIVTILIWLIIFGLSLGYWMLTRGSKISSTANGNQITLFRPSIYYSAKILHPNKK